MENMATHFLFKTNLPKKKEVIAKRERLSNKTLLILECPLNSSSSIKSAALIPKSIKKEAKILLIFI